MILPLGGSGPVSHRAITVYAVYSTGFTKLCVLGCISQKENSKDESDDVDGLHAEGSLAEGGE